MKKKRILMAIAIIVVFIVTGTIYLLNKQERKRIDSSDTVRIEDVDKVAGSPGDYKGYMGVAGKVLKLDTDTNFFQLGCNDACVAIPVKYMGNKPKKNDNVVIYGEIKKNDIGIYFFYATELKVKGKRGCCTLP